MKLIYNDKEISTGGASLEEIKEETDKLYIKKSEENILNNQLFGITSSKEDLDTGYIVDSSLKIEDSEIALSSLEKSLDTTNEGTAYLNRTSSYLSASPTGTSITTSIEEPEQKNNDNSSSISTNIDQQQSLTFFEISSNYISNDKTGYKTKIYGEPEQFSISSVGENGQVCEIYGNTDKLEFVAGNIEDHTLPSNLLTITPNAVRINGHQILTEEGGTIQSLKTLQSDFNDDHDVVNKLYIDTALKSKADILLTSKTLYVSNSGNDLTGDGTESNPFATIQRAINSLPKNLNGKFNTINVASGEYSGFVIRGFYGGSISNKHGISIFGNSGGGTVITGGVEVSGCETQIKLAYLEVTGTASTINNITCLNSTHVDIVFCKCTGTAATRGIWAERSTIGLLYTNISNKTDIGVLIDESICFASQIGGENNNICFQVGSSSSEFPGLLIGNNLYLTGKTKYEYKVNGVAIVDQKMVFSEELTSDVDNILPTQYGGTGNSTGYITAGAYNKTSMGAQATAEGCDTTAEASYSHAEGFETKATGLAAHAEGYRTAATKDYTHAEGKYSNAKQDFSHAEGQEAKAESGAAHAEGFQTRARGFCSHAGGANTIAGGYASTAIGRFNVTNTTQPDLVPQEDNWFCVGKGTSEETRSNCFRVTSNGVYASGNYGSSGADYAEYFEWADGNPDNEDRCGRFVTLDGENICLAQPEDNFILGIVSGNPSVVGGTYDDQWQGMYLNDIYGRPIQEEIEVPAQLDRDKNIAVPSHIEYRQKLNPDYDGTQKYIPRSERPEWDAVGMLGKLVTVDDGTCEPNSWCTVGEGGIATASIEQTRYRCLSRLDETHIRVLVL